MEMEPTQNTNDPQQQVQSLQQPQGPDIVKLLWRWKWLPILGGAIGLTVGYLIYNQQPPQYQAYALINVEAPGMRQLPLDAGGMYMAQKGISDELIVIRSSKVLDQAIRQGSLNNHPKLAGRSNQEIIEWLKKEKVLDTKLASKDQDTNVVQVSVTSDDAELSGKALEAVVRGYQEYVSEKLESSSTDAINALRKYNDQYEREKEDSIRDTELLKRNKDLLWVEGKPQDPLAAKLLALQTSIIQVESKASGLGSLLEQVKEAQANGRPVESILRLIASSSTETMDRLAESANSKLGFEEVRMSRSAILAFENTEVAPIRRSLKLELENLGEEHPTVKNIRQKLKLLEEELDSRRKDLVTLEESFNKMMGEQAADALPSVEMQLKTSVIALNEELARLNREKMKYTEEVETIRPRVQENSRSIASFLQSQASLEALGKTSEEISAAVNKLVAATDYNQKTIRVLEQSSLGVFVGPQLIRYLGIGGFLGFAAFCGLAYLLELADRSYRGPDEIASDLGMPIIGHLPLTSLANNKRVDIKIDSSVVTVHKSKSSVSEAFRGIRTALFFNNQQGNLKVIQVTSPIPGDGKSTIAANVAVSIAQSGRKVCLVDCDLRRPRVSKIFGVGSDVGLVQVISDKSKLDEAVQPSSVENLFVLSCGRRPANPAELLSSERFQAIISELRTKFDYVILDTPPVLVVSDPATVAPIADGVILTVRLRRNLKPIAIRASQMLHAMNANMIGVVVNGVGVGANGYGYGGYRYDAYNNSYGAKGYGKSGYGGYGYGATYQYGGYYGGSMVGRDYYSDDVPKPAQKKLASTSEAKSAE
ncbi:MAG: polysaccharide biosynthesis tyrosine autokinase [Pirellula sp.]|nr:polysaccharide biosynthesis tyrosine autokinase [Pirellula sp.]